MKRRSKLETFQRLTITTSPDKRAEEMERLTNEGWTITKAYCPAKTKAMTVSVDTSRLIIVAEMLLNPRLLVRLLNGNK